MPAEPSSAQVTMAGAQLAEAAARLAVALERTGQRIVFAESCTAGLVAASLGQIAGISRWLCGSFVVYQEASKQQWLGVSAESLQQYTAVSGAVAIEMAQGALLRTAHADLAVSITGHLGPGAPPNQDGLAFVAIAGRNRADQSLPIEVHRLDLPPMLRPDRQQLAARSVLDIAAAWLDRAR